MLRLMFGFLVHILISMDHGLGMEMCEETHSETLRMFDATSTVLQKNTLTRPHCKCQQHRNNLLQLGSRNVQHKVYRCMNGCCHLPIECWSLGSKENREPHPECNTCHSPGSPPPWTNIDVSFTPSIFTALASDEKAPVAWHDIMASDKSRFICVYIYAHTMYLYIYIQIDCLGPSSIIKSFVPLSCIDIVWRDSWSLGGDNATAGSHFFRLLASFGN